MKTVAIVGMAESTRHLAPWDNKDVEIWCMNESYVVPGEDGKAWLKRWDRWFQMHKPFDYRRPNNHNDPKHWAWLQEPHDFPIYMQDEDPLVPGSTKYPKDEIVAKFLGRYEKTGTDGKPIEYFSSSFVYMLALALYEGFERIELYGIELGSETEYAAQRPNGEFWLGIAGQHATVVLPNTTALLAGVRYGYDQVPKLNRMQMEVRVMGMHRERKKYAEQLDAFRSELVTIEQQLAAFGKDVSRVKALKKRKAEITAQADGLVARINILTGHIDEAKFVIDTIDALGGEIEVVPAAVS